jgi:FtsH-binding integral membrane protein
MYNTISNSIDSVNERMKRVYLNMTLAVTTSMLVSYLVGNNAAAMAFFFTGAMTWVTILAPLAFIFIVPILFNSGIGYAGKQLVLHAFAAVMGLSMATVFAVYTQLSIVQGFLGAAVLFLSLTLYGYTTKKDLTSWGTFLFVGLIAIIIVSLINIFLLQSGVLATAISAAAILIFLGLTAYDTQKIKEQLAYDTDGTAEVSGALTLYLDFINLFINLVQIFGQRK